MRLWRFFFFEGDAEEIPPIDPNDIVTCSSQEVAKGLARALGGPSTVFTPNDNSNPRLRGTAILSGSRTLSFVVEEVHIVTDVPRPWKVASLSN